MFSYENYVDRQDVNGGLDVGYEAVKDTYLVAGYRYGRQDQFTLPGAERHNPATALTAIPITASSSAWKAARRAG